MSNVRAIVAVKFGKFENETIPVTVKTKGGYPIPGRRASA